MTPPRRAVALAVVSLMACGAPTTDTTTPTDDTGSTTDTDPKDSADDTEDPDSNDPHALPKALRDVLPRNDDGLPVISTGPGELDDGAALELAYDATLSDPITNYGDCLALVGTCYDGDLNALSTCIGAIARCGTDAGGDGCCPGACLDAFAEADGGRNSDDAVDATFVEGSCFEGFHAFRDAFGTAPGETP